MLKRAFILCVLLAACTDRKPDNGIFVRLSNLPPNGESKIFNSRMEVYFYFRDLSRGNELIMIDRLKDERPLVDSLRALLVLLDTEDSIKLVQRRMKPLEHPKVTITGPKEIILDKDGK
jgi:hypothetical protein